MKNNKYMNEILDIIYNQTDSFNLNLRYSEDYISDPEIRGRLSSEAMGLNMQELYLIPYLGKKGSDFNRKNCKEVIDKINKVINQYKHDMWEEDKKQGIKYNEMTNYFVEPINEEFAQIMEKFLGQELKDMNPKGNA